MPVGLTPRRQVTLYLVAGGLWLSGALWLLFHYFLRRPTAFGFTPHPLEHWWLVIHGSFGFAGIWLFGVLWAAHVKSGWSMRWRRRSGGSLFAVVVFLILTGLGLYYIDDEVWLSWTKIAHWAVGLGALAAFLAHFLSKSAPRRAQRRVASS